MKSLCKKINGFNIQQIHIIVFRTLTRRQNLAKTDEGKVGLSDVEKTTGDRVDHFPGFPGFCLV